MARYAPDHKQKTRVHIVEVARETFRREGFDRSSIDVLMKAAGLTRGAFYAHFDSKEALVAEALTLPSGLERALTHEDTSAPQDGAAVFADYLDPSTREDRVVCPLVAHPMDARRGGASRQQAYETHARTVIDALEKLGVERKDAAVTTALAVGAAILGAAVHSDELATLIETSAREAIETLANG